MDSPVAYPPVHTADPADDGKALSLTVPAPADGLALHRLAEAVGGLDVNSAYSYHLWCRDFAASSVVARAGDALVGFVTGFRRPSAPDRLFVWQVAVHPDWRGRRLGASMLAGLVGRLGGPRVVEATVTPSNIASRRMFERFAADHGASVVDGPFLRAEEFPDDHEPEVLLVMGPFPVRPTEHDHNHHPAPSGTRAEHASDPNLEGR